MIQRFLSNERGATAIEYALIASLIFLAIVASIQPVGIALQGIFGDASTGLQSGAP